MTSPDIALVVLDTVRKDVFKRHFDWLPGVRYDNAWSTSHYTVAAHASLFTGRYAREMGVHLDSPELDCPNTTLGELLAESGYTTWGVSANTYVSKYFNFDKGFDHFSSKTRVVEGEESDFNWPKFIKEHKNQGIGRYFQLLKKVVSSNASTITTLKTGIEIKLRDLGIIEEDRTYTDGAEILDYVRTLEFEQNDPNFLFVNLMDAHGPYRAPEEYRTTEPVHYDATEMLITGKRPMDPDQAKQAYEDCVRYLSDVYEELFEELTDSFDHVITVADHGEAFGEGGGWGHSNGLWPEVTHVPLVVTDCTDSSPVEPTSEPVNLHDVFRTVSDLADVTPPSTTRGRSLIDAAEFENRQLLLESHGIPGTIRERLAADGVDKETLDVYDVDLNAVATKPGYAFETFSEKIEHRGAPIPDAKSKIRELVDGLDIRDGTGSAEVPEHVDERLENLGYK